MSDVYSRLMAAAHAGAFGINEQELPSAEQCKAGNYRMGRVKLHGLPLVIEVPQGQRRMGKEDGKPWSTILMAHYGYIAKTTGADGDALDVFVGPVPESQRVWVVNQVKAGAFDEHKILLGFNDRESAVSAYMNSYERGWQGLGSVVACSINQLVWWVKYGDTTKPLTDRALPHDGINDMNETVWDSAADPVGCDFADLIYQLRRADGEGLMLDAVTLADIMEDSDGEVTLDALVVPYVKAERKAEQLRIIMASVGGEVQPLNVQVTQPFKQRGTTNVVILFELSDGQTVSIWMHNPDSTPNKIMPQDELVSWRWLLNKKDITLLVAPERGQDLNPREVARRIMKLAQKNSARFAKANANRADRMAGIESLKGDISSKEAALASLDALFADYSERAEAKRNRKPATLQADDQGASAERPAVVEATVQPAPAVVEPQVTEPEQVEDESGDLAPDGRENVVKTAKGTKVVTGFKVVEAKRLIVSHDIDGKPNPDYPHELQPRDRARATSQAWVQKTSRNLDPDSLGRTQRADSGAPIVGPDAVVESGNGRTMAIIEAYRIGEADEYRAWLIEEAAYFGIDPAKIERMKAPVLVRVRTSDVDRAVFAVEANQDDKLAMTATEKARSDAKRLTDAIIVKMAADGDLLAAANRDFIAAFLQSLGDAEAAQYLTSNGQPTASLVARLQAAIFAKAYNDDRLLELTADSAKPEIASIINALNIAAPDFIRAQSADRAGAEAASEKLADSVELSLNQQAVDAIIGATGVLKSAKDSGMSLEEFLRQGDMFGDIDPAVAAMAVFISKNNRSAKRMGTAFKAMAEFVQGEIEKRQTGSLFGDADETGFADIVAAANRKLDQEYGEGAFSIGTADLFNAPEPAQVAPDPSPEPAPEPAAEPAAEQTHSEWEGEVTEIIAEKLNITTSDAQGMVEAQDFYMTQSWGKGMTAQETADKIMAESRAPEDEQIEYARAYLQSVIDGDEDFLDEGLAERLEKIHDDYADNDDVMALFNSAAQAYSDYMVAQARAALA